jgi:hypothetical protein
MLDKARRIIAIAKSARLIHHRLEGDFVGVRSKVCLSADDRALSFSLKLKSSAHGRAVHPIDAVANR